MREVPVIAAEEAATGSRASRRPPKYASHNSQYRPSDVLGSRNDTVWHMNGAPDSATQTAQVDVATAASEIVARTRAEQGLPPRITGAALRRIATLLTHPAEGYSASGIEKQ